MAANPTVPVDISKLADQIHDKVAEARELLDRYDLDERPGAAEKLPSIARLAATLAEALSELCGPERVRELAACEKRDVAERFADLSEHERRIILAMRPFLASSEEEERNLARAIAAVTSSKAEIAGDPPAAAKLRRAASSVVKTFRSTPKEIDEDTLYARINKLGQVLDSL